MKTTVKSFYIVLAFLCFLGCKDKPDGRYIAYDSKPTFDTFGKLGRSRDHNDTLDNELKNDLIGKKFNIKFDEDFITLGHLNSSLSDIMLKKEVSPENIVNYAGDKKVGNVTFEFTMLANGTNILMLNVACLIPVKYKQEDGYAGLLRNHGPKAGNIVVWLKKTE